MNSVVTACKPHPFIQDGVPEDQGQGGECYQDVFQVFYETRNITECAFNADDIVLYLCEILKR